MADKQISDLVAASSVETADLFVLEQNGTAKKLTGQILINWMTSYADGHGGIQDITWTTSGVSGNGQYHYATIHYSDGTTGTFTIRDGIKGDTGAAWHVFIKYASQEPTQDSDMGDNPDNWIGIYCGTAITAPDHYTSYDWFEIKGEKGDTGDSIAQIRKTGTSGLVDTYTVTTQDGVNVGTFTVTNGDGGVSTVNDIAPDGDGNVPCILGSVGDLGLTVGSATISDAYTALENKQTLACPATDFANAQLPYTGSEYLTDGTVEIFKGESANEGWIRYRGSVDYRMAIASGVPSGTWAVIFDGVSVVSGNTTSGGSTKSGYIKNPDGTLICWKRVDVTNYSMQTTWGALYYGNRIDLGDWPEAFIRDPVVSAIGGPGGNEIILGRINDVSPTSAGNVYPYSPVSMSTGSIAVSIVGYGKWK